MPLVTKTFSDIITFTRASSATYFNAAGTLTTATTDVARFDYDPATLSPRGLLIEEARTNILMNSGAIQITHQVVVTGGSGSFTDGETVNATGGGTGTYVAGQSSATSFGIAAGSGTFTGTLTGATSGATKTITTSLTVYNRVRSSVTANAVASPAGTTTAGKLVEDTSTNTHLLRIDIGVTNATAYTMSVFAKAGERTQVAVAFGNDNSAFATTEALFTLTGSGTAATNAGSPQPTITLLANGWYRCSITSTSTATATAAIRITLASGGNNTYTGDGTSGLYLWGAQLEAGAFPTSYIATTTASVARAADVASVNTLSPWYNASAGTLYAQGVLVGGTASTFPWQVSLVGANANTDSIGIVWAAASGQMRFGVRSGGVSQADISVAPGKSANSTFKFAGRYATNDFQGASDGNLGTADTSGTIPTISALSLGGVVSFQPRPSVWLQRVQYYPRTFTDAELQTLTT